MPRARPADEPELNRLIGLRVRQLRAAKGWSMEAVAEQIGVSYQQIQKYECGTNTVSPAKLVALSRTFGVPVGYFFKESDEMEMGTVLDAGLLRLIGHLVLIQREKPEALEKVRGLVRGLRNEIQGVGPTPRPHRRKKADQGVNTARQKKASQSP